MQITVSRNELLAALLFASTDESRYTLNSVCVQVKRGSKPIIVATDGRRLAVIKTVADQVDEFTESHDLLLCSEFVRPICALSKTLGGKLFPWVQFGITPGSKRVTVELVGAGLVLHADRNAVVEGAYPKWELALPQKSKHGRTPITDMGINAELVGDFAKASKILECKNGPVVQMNLVGKEAAVEVKIIGAENFYGLVMQCKCDNSVEYQPEFVSVVKDLPKPEEETQ
jgi:hypothetical protein